MLSVQALRLLGRTRQVEITEAGIGMVAEQWFSIFRDPLWRQRSSIRWSVQAVRPRESPQALQGPVTLRPREIETDFEETAPLVFHDEPGQ